MHQTSTYTIGDPAYTSTADPYALSCLIAGLTITYNYELSNSDPLPSPLFTENGPELTVVSSTPGDAETYSINMIVTADDGLGNTETDTQSFTITVAAAAHLIEDVSG